MGDRKSFAHCNVCNKLFEQDFNLDTFDQHLISNDHKEKVRKLSQQNRLPNPIGEIVTIQLNAQQKKDIEEDRKDLADLLTDTNHLIDKIKGILQDEYDDPEALKILLEPEFKELDKLELNVTSHHNKGPAQYSYKTRQKKDLTVTKCHYIYQNAQNRINELYITQNERNTAKIQEQQQQMEEKDKTIEKLQKQLQELQRQPPQQQKNQPSISQQPQQQKRDETKSADSITRSSNGGFAIQTAATTTSNDQKFQSIENADHPKLSFEKYEISQSSNEHMPSQNNSRKESYSNQYHDEDRQQYYKKEQQRPLQDRQEYVPSYSSQYYEDELESPSGDQLSRNSSSNVRDVSNKTSYCAEDSTKTVTPEPQPPRRERRQRVAERFKDRRR